MQKSDKREWFKEYFENHPDQVAQRSNDEAMAAYAEAHDLKPTDISMSVKNSLFAVKQGLRKAGTKSPAPKRVAKPVAPASVIVETKKIEDATVAAERLSFKQIVEQTVRDVLKDVLPGTIEKVLAEFVSK